MTRATWKHGERRIATLLGGRRVPVSGRARGSAPDIDHEHLSIEVKCRKTIPAWLHTAMAQARAAQRGDQLPTVVLHEEGQRYENAYVVHRLCDYRHWYGDVHPEHPEGVT